MITDNKEEMNLKRMSLSYRVGMLLILVHRYALVHYSILLLGDLFDLPQDATQRLDWAAIAKSDLEIKLYFISLSVGVHVKSQPHVAWLNRVQYA